jgi:quinol monooxygenase YgiN
MAIRLLVTVTATPGKGSDLALAYRERCVEAMQEPGCEQYEVFQSVLDPDKLVLLERWADEAALEAHAKVHAKREPIPDGLRSGTSQREYYQYNRTRNTNLRNA